MRPAEHKWIETCRYVNDARCLFIKRVPNQVHAAAAALLLLLLCCCCCCLSACPIIPLLSARYLPRRCSINSYCFANSPQVLLRESAVAGILVNFCIGANWFAVNRARQVTTNRRPLLHVDRPSSQPQTKQKNTQVLCLRPRTRATRARQDRPLQVCACVHEVAWPTKYQAKYT